MTSPAVCTPVGLSRMFTVMGQLLVKPTVSVSSCLLNVFTFEHLLGCELAIGNISVLLWACDLVVIVAFILIFFIFGNKFVFAFKILTIDR